jgi:hypothetical protein
LADGRATQWNRIGVLRGEKKKAKSLLLLMIIVTLLGLLSLCRSLAGAWHSSEEPSCPHLPVLFGSELEFGVEHVNLDGSDGIIPSEILKSGAPTVVHGSVLSRWPALQRWPPLLERGANHSTVSTTFDALRPPLPAVFFDERNVSFVGGGGSACTHGPSLNCPHLLCLTAAP